MTEPAKTRDLSVYKDKEPTSLHKHFAEWIENKTGIRPSDKDVQLVVALYADFQASPENKERQEKEKAEKKAAQEAARANKKGGPRSPEARELKQLKAAAETLESLKQPVPAATKKRIAELEAEIAKATGDAEVPAQKSDETAPAKADETINA
jgi:hypothetical protein